MSAALKKCHDRWYPLKKHPVQLALVRAVDNGIRFPLVPAGRRSGKTERFKRYLSKTVMSKGLDAGTAFEILSIDIADVDVGDNIGAKLQADQAEADKHRFQAEAEKRRALAMALEQEMKALTQENRAKVVLAEAEIPKAMAEAFRSGNLGIMDYYKMKNIQSDTTMRNSIGGAPGQSNPPATQ